ncbi:acyl-CoA synthetase [Ramlibacter sp. PS3R-8]|uniref:LpxL/LpxP family acyltransferase n=1 Tax=Ramlibacter sp. PS3R-8 TaxID=3133437 RepID=UPI003096C069
MSATRESADNTAAWVTQAERSNPLALRMMRWIALTLGRRLSRLLLHPITLYFVLAGGPTIEASADYLQRVLGRAPRWRDRYGHVHHFAATILDRVYLLRGDYERFDIDVVGIEHLDAVLRSERGAFLLGAHLGSFEVLRAMSVQRPGARVAMLMYEQNAQLLMQILRAIAPDATQRIIGLGRMQAMLELRDWLDAGGVAGLLADRTLHGPDQHAGAARSRMHWIDFMGRPAAFSDGPFRLAALLRRPVLFMTGLYLGGNRYQIHFVPLADFSDAVDPATGGKRAPYDAAVDAAILRYARLLEQHCRLAPRNWFNFFDFWAGSRGPQNAPHASSDTP